MAAQGESASVDLYKTRDGMLTRLLATTTRPGPSEDVVEQTEQTFLNMAGALAEAGAEMRHVVRVRYILPDRSLFARTWPVLQKWFGDVRPAATMI